MASISHISYKGYDVCSENKKVIDLFYDKFRDQTSIRNATASIVKSLKDEKDVIVSNLSVVRNIHDDIMRQAGVSVSEKEFSHKQFIDYEDKVLQRLAEIESLISETYNVYIESETKYLEDFISMPERYTRRQADNFAQHCETMMEDYKEFVSLHDEYMRLLKTNQNCSEQEFAQNQKFYYEELKLYPFFDIKKGDALMKVAQNALDLYTDLTNGNDFQPDIY